MEQMIKPVKSDTPEVVCIRCNQPGYRTTRMTTARGKRKRIMMVIHPHITHRDKTGTQRRKECYVGAVESFESAMAKTEQRNKPVTRKDYEELIDELVRYTASMTRSRRSGAIRGELKQMLQKYRLWDDKAIKAMQSDEPMIELESGTMIPTGEGEKHE